MRNIVLREESDFYTVPELAKILEISRISVFRRVSNGSIKGQKFGRDFIIFKKDIDLPKLKSILRR